MKGKRERVFEWNYLAHPSPKGGTRLLSNAENGVTCLLERL